jgi:histidinol-phosphatase
VILREAGGRFSDLTGTDGYTGGSGVASNGILHDDALALFRGGA